MGDSLPDAARMIIGVVKEIRPDENRVGLLPVGAETLVRKGHQVLAEHNCGAPSGFEDEAYATAGAEIVATAAEVFARADMIIKVKEPQPAEFPLIRENQIVFTYFHFAASEDLTRALLDRKCIAIAYETIESDNGQLPLLTPMSEVAGRMAMMQGAKYLEREHGGRGVLLSGVPGVPPATVVVVGAGIVGTQAARMAAGLGAKVYILDVNLERLRYLSDVMPPNVFTLMSNPENLREALQVADVVVSSVLLRGAKAPKLITRQHLQTMKKGAVIVDVAIDQGGSTETSRPTSHQNPIYEVDGIIHYCVTNMPGAMPLTSTQALTNATLPFAHQIANQGWQAAAQNNPAIARGVNLAQGHITYEAVAEAFDLPYMALATLLKKQPMPA